MRKYSELRSQHRLNLRDHVPLAAPLTVYVEPTDACHEHMPMSLYEKLISDMRQLPPVKSLKLYLMGEPLLNKNLGKMIKMAREAGVAERIEVTSDGLMLTRDRALELIESGLQYLCVSIYSVDERRQRETTKCKVTPAEVLLNVALLRDLRDDMRSATPYLNAEMLADTPEANARFMAAYTRVADEATVTYPYRKGFPIRRAACTFPFYTLAVRCNGSVVTCCADWNGGTAVGDIRTESLGEMWRGERLLRLQKMHLEGRRSENSSCRNCSALHYSPGSIDGLSGQELQDRWEDRRHAAFVPAETLALQHRAVL